MKKKSLNLPEGVAVPSISNCPKCGAQWTYEYKHRTYSYVLGIEDRARYDGVSEWKCNQCKTRWDRLTGEVIKRKKEAK